MSETELKTDAAKVETEVKADVAQVESRVAALEASAKTWYEKHLPLLTAIGGFAVGALAVYAKHRL